MSSLTARESLAANVVLSKLTGRQVPSTVRDGLGGLAVPVLDGSGTIVDWALDPLTVVLSGDPSAGAAFYRWRQDWTEDTVRLPATLLDIPGIDTRWRQPGTVVFTPDEVNTLIDRLTTGLDTAAGAVVVTRDPIAIGAQLGPDNPSTAVGVLWDGQEQTVLSVDGVQATWTPAGLQVDVSGNTHQIGSWLPRGEQVWMIPPVDPADTSWKSVAGRMIHGWLQAGGNMDANFAQTVSSVAGHHVDETMLSDLEVYVVDVDSTVASVLWALSPFTGYVHAGVDAHDAMGTLTGWLADARGAVSYTRL